MEYLILFTFNIQQLSSVAYRLNPHSHAYYSNAIWNKSLQKEKKNDWYRGEEQPERYLKEHHRKTQLQQH